MPSSNSFEVSESIHSLQTAQPAEFLNIVDSLRSQGLSEFTNLPQLVVCGDQSSGKSSVLEAISGIPFPRQDTLCTRFATEVILRRTLYESISVSIVPASDRSPSDRQRLLSFRHELNSRNDFPTLFEKATNLITASRTFSKDVLRVELCGPKQPQLTLVDLPGLIHSDISSPSSGNVELVSDLVDSYLRNPRSVILAVVSAKNDISNQAILKRARDVDARGTRTLGIITKPDKLDKNSKSEAAFLNLARNKEYIFDLGWHVVKNLDSALEESAHGRRDEEESSFFRNSNFRTLSPKIVGIGELRTRLSKVLFDQIRIELPKLIEEIESRLTSCRIELEKLGPDRVGEVAQKEFLINLSQSFQAISHDAVRGYYDHSFFHMDKNPTRRLCAELMNMHFRFAKKLTDSGALWKIVEEKGNDRRHRTRAEAIIEACELLKRSRGQELPGLPNPLLVGELFREYSRPWEGLAKQHIKQVWDAVYKFLELVLLHLTDVDVSNTILRLFLLPKMEACLKTASSKLAELVAVHMYQPITTNVAFVDNRKSFQLTNLKHQLKEKLGTELTGSRQTFSMNDVTRMVDNLALPGGSDMDMGAAEDAFDNMNSFYQVAMNLFTDNVPTLAIQAPIVREVPGLFCPSVITSMGPELVKRIAGESEDKIRDRVELQRQLKMLEEGSRICKEHTLPLQTATGSEGQPDPATPNGADSVGIDYRNESVTATPNMTTTSNQLSVPSSNSSVERPPTPTSPISRNASPGRQSKKTSVSRPSTPSAASATAGLANQSHNTTSILANLPVPTVKVINFNDPPVQSATLATGNPSIFGSTSTTGKVESSSSTVPPPTTNIFANLNTAQNQSVLAFGSPSPASQTGDSQVASSASTGGRFATILAASSSTAPSTSLNLFGSSTTVGKDSQSAFGISGSSAPATSPNPFGSSATVGKGSQSVFGTSSSTAPPTGPSAFESWAASRKDNLPHTGAVTPFGGGFLGSALDSDH